MINEYYLDIERKHKEQYIDELETERLILRKSDDVYEVIYSIYLKNNNEHIGEIILTCNSEVKYGLYDEENKRKGYMTEAMQKILEITYEKYLEAFINSKNKASIATAKKLGFEYRENFGEDLIFVLTKKIN